MTARTFKKPSNPRVIAKSMPGVDFNFGADPYALEIILKSGIPVHIVPMDVTWFCAIHKNDLAGLEPKTVTGRLSLEIMQAYCEGYSPDGNFRFHDPCCVYAALHPDMFIETVISLDLHEGSPEFGRVREDENGCAIRLFRPDTSSKDIIENMMHSLVK